MNFIQKNYLRKVRKLISAMSKKLRLKTILSFLTMPFRIIWRIYTMGCTGFFIIIFLVAFLFSAWGNTQDHVKSVFFRSYNEEKFHLEEIDTIAADILKFAEKREYKNICQYYHPSNAIENCPNLMEKILESRRYAFQQHRGIRITGYKFSEDMKSVDTAYLARYLSDEPGSNPFSGIEMEISLVRENKTWQVSDLYWILYEEQDMPNVPTVWGIYKQLGSSD